MPNIKKEKKEAILELYEQGYKQCPLCEVVKPVSEFYTTSIAKTRWLLPLSPKCKLCGKILYKLRCKQIKAYKKEEEKFGRTI